MGKRSCGIQKCFFKSISDPNVGYLVGRQKKTEASKTSWDRVKRGWKMAKDLEEEFGIKHFLLEPPRLCVNCNSREVAERLRLPKATQARKSHLVVQKVRPSPKARFFSLRLYSLKNRKDAMKWIQSYQKCLPRCNKKPNTTAAYFQQLETEFDICDKIVRKYPRYANDFQVLVDVQTGNIYHIDFDRAFEHYVRQETVDRFSIFYKAFKTLTDSSHSLSDGNSTGSSILPLRTSQNATNSD